VFNVAPKHTRPLGERLAGGKQRGAIGNPHDSAPVKKDPWSMERNVKDRTRPPATMRNYRQELRNFDWGNENVKNERLPQKEARTGNPYESGGGRTALGQVLYGGKQRGAVGNLNPENTDYRGMHTAPYNGRGSPLHDLTDTYPPDIYGPMGANYYGHNNPPSTMDKQTVAQVQALRGKPNASVNIYRAVPKTITDRQGKRDSTYAPSITKRDWVTINPDYARMHGESTLRGNYKILSKKVKARDLYTMGDSIHEWGYDPQEAEHRALGGPVDAGSPYVVGENGPEVIVPNKSGQVVPTAAVAQAKKMLKGAPPAGVNLSKVRYK
jgi:hypothetical protein